VLLPACSVGLGGNRTTRDLGTARMRREWGLNDAQRPHFRVALVVEGLDGRGETAA
jgi:hypothetical protein